MFRRDLLFAIKCTCCYREFVYCINSGRDFRCYKCKQGMTAEEVERELSEMPEDEKRAFMQDIKEYEEEYGRIITEDLEE